MKNFLEFRRCTTKSMAKKKKKKSRMFCILSVNAENFLKGREIYYFKSRRVKQNIKLVFENGEYFLICKTL